MIDDVHPELTAAGLKLALRDVGDSTLTLQVVKNAAGVGAVGIGVSEGSAITAVQLTRADRAALIGALVELQEDESLL